MDEGGGTLDGGPIRKRHCPLCTSTTALPCPGPPSSFSTSLPLTHACLIQPHPEDRPNVHYHALQIHPRRTILASRSREEILCDFELRQVRRGDVSYELTLRGPAHPPTRVLNLPCTVFISEPMSAHRRLATLPSPVPSRREVRSSSSSPFPVVVVVAVVVGVVGVLVVLLAHGQTTPSSIALHCPAPPPRSAIGLGGKAGGRLSRWKLMNAGGTGTVSHPSLARHFTPYREGRRGPVHPCEWSAE